MDARMLRELVGGQMIMVDAVSEEDHMVPEDQKKKGEADGRWKRGRP